MSNTQGHLFTHNALCESVGYTEVAHWFDGYVHRNLDYVETIRLNQVDRMSISKRKSKKIKLCIASGWTTIDGVQGSTLCTFNLVLESTRILGRLLSYQLTNNHRVSVLECRVSRFITPKVIDLANRDQTTQPCHEIDFPVEQFKFSEREIILWAKI